MRLMSFSLTERQLLEGTKDVTRRLGWKTLKPGQRLKAVRKAMGLKKGEKAHVLCEIEVVSVQRERLNRIVHTRGYGQNECKREGFPEMSPEQFVEFFRKSHKGCKPETVITRIEFRRVE